ncbi:hypothetical protein D9758_017186 [Tetrapyrgos nigripes]|uniref:Uncharacterized protein n=1 Tax=Tetrapyrgos nigripes TaxID=182062 RepID=A0A8H5BYN6_9AGAR|nr:hypothetical protein D9758_017186 [Tetrapyrgos nigripes]
MWTQLPPELKLAVADLVVDTKSRSLAYVDRATYDACLPALFRTIRLENYSSLQHLIKTVPAHYARFIHRLDVCTSSSVPVIDKTTLLSSFLQSCVCLKDLTLRLDGSLHYTLRDAFVTLSDLTKLTVINCANEVERPLSERFVVSLCASLPRLTHLSLDNISRSSLHATDHAAIPLVTNDNSIPPLPTLPHLTLSLPSLLSIPTLRALSIHNTHLGDPRWGEDTLEVNCRLESLDLGGYVYSHSYSSYAGFSGTGMNEEEEMRMWTERIVRAVGCCQHDNFKSSSSSLVSLSLTSSFSPSGLGSGSPAPSLLSSSNTKPNPNPRMTLPSLRSLHLSPFFPYFSPVSPTAPSSSDVNPDEPLPSEDLEDEDAFSHSLSNLASSPIERIEIQCYEDDLVDVCKKVEGFIRVREARQPQPQPRVPTRKTSSSSSSFFKHLRQIDVVSVKDQDQDAFSASRCGSGFVDPLDEEDALERAEALRSLQHVCREARLASSVREARMRIGGASLEYLDLDVDMGSVSTTTSVERVGVDGRVRSMTI